MNFIHTYGFDEFWAHRLHNSNVIFVS